MPVIPLPQNPSIDHLKKQAKRLHAARTRGRESALALIREFHPEFAHQADKTLQNRAFSLLDAQLVIARQYGFASWPKLKDAIERRHWDPIRVDLDDAIRNENPDAIDAILKAHPHLLHEDLWHRNWGPPLAHAAQLGKFEAVRRLIELGADEFEWAFGRACLHGYNEIAAYLYEKDPAIDIDTLLTGPCEALNEQGIRFLLGLGADPNRLHGAEYPLDLAIRTYSPGTNRQACINALIEGGAHYTDGHVFDILSGRRDRLAARLKADPNTAHRHFDLAEGRRRNEPAWADIYGGYYGGAPLKDTTLLHFCAEYGALEEARILVSAGADVNARALPDNNGIGNQTPIYHAVNSAGNHSFPVLEFLLERGADLNIRSTLRVPHRAYYDEATPHPVFEDMTPLGYVSAYPQSYCPGPGSGDSKGVDNSPHENVVALLKQYGARK